MTEALFLRHMPQYVLKKMPEGNVQIDLDDENTISCKLQQEMPKKRLSLSSKIYNLYLYGKNI